MAVSFTRYEGVGFLSFGKGLMDGAALLSRCDEVSEPGSVVLFGVCLITNSADWGW